MGLRHSLETGCVFDPDQLFGLAFVTGVPRNFSEFSDEKIDKSYDEQARALDPARRKQIVFDMQRRLFELVPCSILLWTVNEMGYWREVRDFKPGIGNYNNSKFQNIWLAE